MHELTIDISLPVQKLNGFAIALFSLKTQKHRRHAPSKTVTTSVPAVAGTQDPEVLTGIDLFPPLSVISAVVQNIFTDISPLAIAGKLWQSASFSLACVPLETFKLNFSVSTDNRFKYATTQRKRERTKENLNEKRSARPMKEHRARTEIRFNGSVDVSAWLIGPSF